MDNGKMAVRKWFCFFMKMVRSHSQGWEDTAGEKHLFQICVGGMGRGGRDKTGERNFQALWRSGAG